MNGVWVDQIASRARRAPRSDASMLTLPKGKIRVRDVGRGERTIVLTPDAPVVLENYDALIALLAPHVRVVCFELPRLRLLASESRVRFFAAGLCGSRARRARSARRAPRHARVHLRKTGSSLPRWPSAIPSASSDWRSRKPRHSPRRSRSVAASTVHVAGVPLIATPVLGQVIMKAARRRIAEEWFRAALPKAFDHKTIWNVARPAYARGAQFCLASIMQGLMHTAAASDFADVSVPTQVTWGLAERTHKKTNKTSFRDHVPHAEMTELQERGHCLDIEDPAAHAARPLGVTQRGLSSLPTPVRRKP